MPFVICVLIGVFLPESFSVKSWMAITGAAFLFLSGLEIETKNFFKDAKSIAPVWVGSFFLPLFLGMAAVLLLPTLFEVPDGVGRWSTAMIVGVALSVSAVPVIIRVLQELSMLDSLLGRKIVLTAVACDLAAWMIFLFILPMGENRSWMVSHIPLALFFVGIGIARLLPGLWEKSSQLKIINNWLVAPLFFVGVGQTLNFKNSFSVSQIALIFALACIGKLLGVWLSTARRDFSLTDRKVMAIALNSRGAMEVLLASVAFNVGLIHESLFMSLVIMAIGTSVVAKPLIKAIYRP